MNKLYTLVFALIATQAFSQSQNPADYKVKGNGFYENKGQMVDQNYQPNHAVKYLLCQPGMNVQLRQTGFSYDTYTEEVKTPSPKGAGASLTGAKFQTPPDITYHYHRVDIELVGCNTAAPLLAEDKSDAYFNYFTAGTPKGGVSDVHYYQKVTYKNIYPNIDLVFLASPNPFEGGAKAGQGNTNIPLSGGQRGAEYLFVVHPGGNPADIKLQYKGANKVSLADNKLIVNVQAGNFTENIPSSYFADTKQQVQVNYSSLGNTTYGFLIPNSQIPNSSDLIIDPTPCLTWATYYGGTGDDIGYGIALDGSNEVYITGYTNSLASIATVGAHQTVYAGGQDIFIAKFNPNGTALLWGTYYGGTNQESGYGISVDGSENVYIVGYAGSGTMATAGAYQTSLVGTTNAIIAKFNSSGSTLMWATYYGGTGNNYGYGIVLDASNNVYITGFTTSTVLISTAGAYQTTFGGVQDGFIAEISSNGASLLWGTYYGSSASETGSGIAIDASNNIYITGYTSGGGSIATIGAYQTIFGGTNDAFVAKFNSSGSALIWATYYGGSADDRASAIAIDASNNVYITGYTKSSSAIATVGAYQTALSVSQNAFVAKFNSTGSSLLWGTYYGGNALYGSESGSGIGLDGSDNVYITGSTGSTTGIATATAFQTVLNISIDVFVSKFSPNGTNLLWGTYYGGSSNDLGYGLTLDASGNVYVTGGTMSTNLPMTAGVYQNFKNGTGQNDAFVAKFGCNPATLGASIGSVTNVNCFGLCTGSATASPSGGTAPYTYNWTPSGGTNATATGLCAGSYTCTVKDASASTVTVSVTITQPTQLRDSITTITNEPCNGNSSGSATVGVKGGTGTYTYNWTPSGGTNATANNLAAGTYTITVKDANGCTATASASITQPAQLRDSISAQGNVSCFGGNNGTLTDGVKGGTGAYTYSWTNGSTNATATGLTAGCYTVTVTDANGCTATASSCITQPAQLRDSITAQTNVLCHGNSTGSLTVGVKGGTGTYTYSWSPSGGTNATANNLTAGSYTVTVKDANGCSVTANAVITQPTALSGIPNANPLNICVGDSSTINVTVSGGTPSYSYSWNTGATTSSVVVHPVTATVYTCTTTDANGCTQVSVVTVNVNSLPTLTLSAAQDTACTASTSDMLTGTPSGGTYSGTAVTGNNFNPNTAGTGIHWVYYTYTDGNSCTNKDSLKITVNTCVGVPGVNALDNQIIFYPNPFTQSINIDNGTNEQVTITMFNMMGQNMGAWQLDKGLNTINTTAYPSGVYMLQVKTKDGVLNKKLMKVN